MYTIVVMLLLFFIGSPLLQIAFELNRRVWKVQEVSQLLTPSIRRSVGTVIFLSLLSQLFGFSDYLLTLTRASFAVLAGLALLSTLFFKIYQINPSDWVRYIYLLGSFFIFFTSIVHTNHMLGVIPYNDLGISFSTLMLVTSLVLACSIAVGVVAFLTRPFKKYKQPSILLRKQQVTRHLSRDMLDHYQKAGLTKQEVESFRNQMAISRDHILNIESNFQVTAKMRSIEIRYNLVKVIKSYFKDIVNEPNRRLDASNFLIKYLPQLNDLLEKYNEINSHVAKNKQTYLILEKSAQTIDKISQEIVDDYLNFHQETYQELEDGIKLADRMLHTSEASDSFGVSQSTDSLHPFDTIDPFDEINSISDDLPTDHFQN